jgi:hypothetical protein
MNQKQKEKDDMQNLYSKSNKLPRVAKRQVLETEIAGEN